MIQKTVQLIHNVTIFLSLECGRRHASVSVVVELSDKISVASRGHNRTLITETRESTISCVSLILTKVDIQCLFKKIFCMLYNIFEKVCYNCLDFYHNDLDL